MGILIPLVLIAFTCLFIWRACDGFETASEYVGRNLSEGVRGGTINAISSSLPELFTTLIALFVLADKDGFAVGIGTTAGSALFNGMIIPALCILVVVGTIVAGKKVDQVEVSQKVILRDGIALIIVQVVLVLILMGSKLDWWQGAVLMAMYAVYLWYMISSMRKSQAAQKAAGGDQIDDDEEEDEDEEEDDAPRSAMGNLFYWLSLGPLLDLEGMIVKERHREQIKNETWNGWPLLLASAGVIGASCWLLVKACEWLGTGSEAHPSYSLFGSEFTGLGMPTMFVAVIFAAMATSVPDTIISIRDARDGDYDDAVANAVGSNIFDICFALGFPLFLYTLIYGPIEMSPETIEESGELRAMLLILTVVGTAFYLIGKRKKDARGGTTVGLGKMNAVVLLGIYGFFLAFILGRSMDAGWAAVIAGWIEAGLAMLPGGGSP